MARFAGVMDDTTGDFERSTIAYCVDVFCISMGGPLGTSPVTAFVESSTGIADGAKTGIASMARESHSSFPSFSHRFSRVYLHGLLVNSIYLTKTLALTGHWSGGALVISGSLMIRNVQEINWSYMVYRSPRWLDIC